MSLPEIIPPGEYETIPHGDSLAAIAEEFGLTRHHGDAARAILRLRKLRDEHDAMPSFSATVIEVGDDVLFGTEADFPSDWHPFTEGETVILTVTRLAMPGRPHDDRLDECDGRFGPYECTLGPDPADHDGGHEHWDEDGVLIGRWSCDATPQTHLGQRVSGGHWVTIPMEEAGDCPLVTAFPAHGESERPLHQNKGIERVAEALATGGYSEIQRQAPREDKS